MPLLLSFSCCRQGLRFPLTINSIVRRLQQTQAVTGWEYQKHLPRKGHNLTERYRRLEKSLRGKEAISKHLIDLPRSVIQVQPTSSSRVKGDAGRFFKGFRIPEEPKPPEMDECCMSGCAICVLDLYQDALNGYRESLASLRDALSKLRIPESRWPVSIRTSATNKVERRRDNVSWGAFEELEKALREKREKDHEDVLIGRVSELQTSTPRGTRPNSGRDVVVQIRSILEGLRWLLFCNR